MNGLTQKKSNLLFQGQQTFQSVNGFSMTNLIFGIIKKFSILMYFVRFALWRDWRKNAQNSIFNENFRFVRFVDDD